jgi:hypothetical protein
MGGTGDTAPVRRAGDGIERRVSSPALDNAGHLLTGAGYRTTRAHPTVGLHAVAASGTGHHADDLRSGYQTHQAIRGQAQPAGGRMGWRPSSRRWMS